MVDKKKKVSAPSIPHMSTRPIRKHDYEDIDEKDLPPSLPPFQASPSTSTCPFRKHNYEDIAEKDFLPAPPHHHADVKPNGNIPSKILTPYHGSSNNHESTRKISNLHGNSFDMSTDTSFTRCV